MKVAVLRRKTVTGVSIWQKMCFYNGITSKTIQPSWGWSIKALLFKILYFEAPLELTKHPQHYGNQKLSNLPIYGAPIMIWDDFGTFWSGFHETTLNFGVEKAHLLPNQNPCYRLWAEHMEFKNSSLNFIFFLNESSECLLSGKNRSGELERSKTHGFWKRIFFCTQFPTGGTQV